MNLHIGDKAPDFTLMNSEGSLTSLSDFKGKNVVLYFFPKSDTPGCTKQSCSFRDIYDMYNKKGIIVIGINYDSPKTLASFKEKYNLPFLLLSDNEKTVSRLYGAYASLINALYPQRITFIINEHGVITHILDNINVTTHARYIIDLL